MATEFIAEHRCHEPILVLTDTLGGWAFARPLDDNDTRVY